MKTNIEVIQGLVDYIDGHLEEDLSLDRISSEFNYSKYHLSKLFVSIVGFPVHAYIQRRRLTEAARLLIFTEQPIIEIALFAGYETQQSFTTGFKTLFKRSPKAFRRKGDFYPFQLKFTADGIEALRGDRIMEIKTVDSGPIRLIGFRENTRFGFFAIGKCWRKLHAKKQFIPHRTEMDFLVGLNDYTNWDLASEKQPAFDYFAAAEVEKLEQIPKGMVVKELPAGRYLIFSFQGDCKDSLEPVADYIYKEWFPKSTCRLNEDARYDFAKYGEDLGPDGKGIIEYWVPIQA